MIKFKQYHSLSIIFILLCFVPSIQAATEAEVEQFRISNRQGDAVITRRDYEHTFNSLMKEAKYGDPFSQYVVGEYFEFGLTGKIDLAKALEWYMASAVQGYARAQKKIGLFSINGKGGLHKSEKEARPWLEKAAAQNDADAQFELGISMCYSKLLPLDCKNGIELLKAAASSKEVINVRARYILGDIFYFGINGHKNINEAVKWFKLSAERHNADALFMLGKIYEFGDEGIQQDAIKSIGYYTDAANKGHTESQYYLGYHYLLKEDYVKALELFNRAAESNYKEAFFALGVMHDKGFGVLADTRKAFGYYLNSAQLKHAPAQLAVAIMYENGWGTNKDLITAYAWYACGDKIQNNDHVQQRMLSISSTFTADSRVKAMELADEYLRNYGTNL
jgi:uncharacterized protein